MDVQTCTYGHSYSVHEESHFADTLSQCPILRLTGSNKRQSREKGSWLEINLNANFNGNKHEWHGLMLIKRLHNYMSLLEFLQPKMDVQLNMPPERPRDIDSEIDWKIIDQLHNAVLGFSRNSIQAKKIMFALLGVLVAAMMQVKNLQTCVKWFPFVIAIIILFWVFDAYTYYYQEKLREAMDIRFRALKRRYPSTNIDDELTLPDKRTAGCRVIRSIFNTSVLLFYPTIIVMIVVIWYLISRGVIS